MRHSQSNASCEFNLNISCHISSVGYTITTLVNSQMEHQRALKIFSYNLNRSLVTVIFDLSFFKWFVIYFIATLMGNNIWYFLLSHNMALELFVIFNAMWIFPKSMLFQHVFHTFSIHCRTDRSKQWWK